MAPNAYESPCTRSSTVVIVGPHRSRLSIALCLGMVGAPICALLCGAGYLLAVAVLEFAFVPPLRSPENYGQFGFLLFNFAGFGMLYGISLAMLAYLRFRHWLPVFVLLSLILYASADLASHFDIMHVWYVAQCPIGLTIVGAAFITSSIVHHRQSAAQQNIAAVPPSADAVAKQNLVE